MIEHPIVENFIYYAHAAQSRSFSIEGSAVSFSWWRPIDGWEVVRGRRTPMGDYVWEEKEYLVPNYSKSPVEIYSPASEGFALFDMDFEEGIEAMLAFANRWGAPWGHGVPIEPSNPDDIARLNLPIEADLGGGTHAIDIEDWEHADRLKALRAAFQLLRAIEAGLQKQQNELLESIAKELRVGDGGSQDPNLVVAGLVNTAFDSPAPSGPTLLYSSVGKGQYSLLLTPADPVSYSALLLAEALSAGEVVEACAVCGKLMSLAADGRLRNKLYCSDACKMRAYRQRKKEAQR